MEEVLDILKYFPRRSFEDSVWGYLEHHSTHLNKCIENSLFESAFFHLHILYMSFLYIQAVRLYETSPDKLAFSFILMEAEKEKKFIKELNDLKTPWIFSGRDLSEKKIPRFFRIAGLSDNDIGIIEEPITFRNKRMHANGKTACENEEDFEKHCSIYLKAIELLLEKQKEILTERYIKAVGEFDEDNEYQIDENDIEKYLSTFSEKEQNICSQECVDPISIYLKEKFSENN